MEFRRPKWEETQDDGLIQAHDWRIFPLLHRRFLFADVENFLLFDLYQPNGSVDENVFAYSNRHNDERGLVIYHNKFADTKGWVKNSAATLDKGSGKLNQRTLAEGLGLPREGYVIFKDYSSQLEYIRSCKEVWEKGMYVELGAYQSHAFMDFRFVGDKEWGEIYRSLNGAGVPSMQAEWRRLFAAEEPVEEKPAKKKRAARKPATKKPTPKTKKVAQAKSIKKPAKKPVVKAKAVKKASKPKKTINKATVTKIVKKPAVTKPKASTKKPAASRAKTTIKKTTTSKTKPAVKKSVSKPAKKVAKKTKLAK